LLKLLYITTNLNSSGGVARVLSVKLNYLIKEFAYNIHIINTNGSTSSLFYHFDEKIQIYSLPQESFKIANILFYKSRLKKTINNIKPDVIVNCDNGLKGSLLPFLFKSKIPLIYENHNSKNAKAATLIGNIKLKLSFFFLSLSASKYKWIIVYHNTKKNRTANNVKIIPNPIGFKLPAISASLEYKVVIAIGRFSYQKGYDKLIKIWSLVVKKHPDWILNIYGEGNNDELKKIAIKLNISNKVQFLTPVIDIKSVYLTASMLLNTSRYEPFGLAVTEAMACGLPVVAFENTLGPKSYINNDENGFLIQKDNLIDYANKIIMLIEDKNKMKSISKNARESMKAYELNTIMSLWRDLFQLI